MNDAQNNLACRPGCGACCVAPSISSALPGMPDGKPAGVRCVNLDDRDYCKVWNTPDYPAVCHGFLAENIACGQSREEAIVLLTIMEQQTQTSSPWHLYERVSTGHRSPLNRLSNS